MSPKQSTILIYVGIFLFGIGLGQLHGFDSLKETAGTVLLIVGLVFYVSGKTS